MALTIAEPKTHSCLRCDPSRSHTIWPLRDVADAEHSGSRPFCNRLDIPETWNLECLNLLMGEDDDCNRRVDEGDGRLLSLVSNKMFERNLLTALTARVGWTPEKTTMSLGPYAAFGQWDHPSSVTGMRGNSVRGLCIDNTCACPA